MEQTNEHQINDVESEDLIRGDADAETQYRILAIDDRDGFRFEIGKVYLKEGKPVTFTDRVTASSTTLEGLLMYLSLYRTAFDLPIIFGDGRFPQLYSKTD